VSQPSTSPAGCSLPSARSLLTLSTSGPTLDARAAPWPRCGRCTRPCTSRDALYIPQEPSGVRPFSPGQFCQSTPGRDAAAIEGETRRADVTTRAAPAPAGAPHHRGVDRHVWMFGIGLTLLIDGLGDDEC
jgi:hypothetical protein